jgi:hypothetical protein
MPVGALDSWRRGSMRKKQARPLMEWSGLIFVTHCGQMLLAAAVLPPDRLGFMSADAYCPGPGVTGYWSMKPLRLRQGSRSSL